MFSNDFIQLEENLIDKALILHFNVIDTLHVFYKTFMLD
jgi:hypothetical protein